MRRFGGVPEVLRPSEVAWVRRIHVGRLRRGDTEGRLAPIARSGGWASAIRPWGRAGPAGRGGCGRRPGSRGLHPGPYGEAGGGGEAGAPRLRLMAYATRKGYRVVLQASDVAAGTVGLSVPGDAVWRVGRTQRGPRRPGATVAQVRPLPTAPRGANLRPKGAKAWSGGRVEDRAIGWYTWF